LGASRTSTPFSPTTAAFMANLPGTGDSNSMSG
jgi:hypothetical protein